MQPELRDRVVTQVCDSTAQLLDSVGTCVCDLAKSSATLLGQVTLIRRENILRQVRGLSSDLSQELREAPLLWPTEQEVVGDQHHLLFRGKAVKMAEDRRLEAQRLSFESMAQSQRKRSTPRQDQPQPKRQRSDPYIRSEPEQPRRAQASYGGCGGRGGSGGAGGKSLGRSGGGSSRRGTYNTQPSKGVKKRF